MTLALAFNPLSATDWLSSFGALGVMAVLFAETGLLIGFFLPGDSLLFTAGLICATGVGGAQVSLPGMLVAAAVGTIVGSQVGYLIGRRLGRAIQNQTNRPRLIAGMRRAEELLERYGPAKAIVLARFVPVVRTVLNPMAGALRTRAAVFTAWQVMGGLVWTVGLILAGYGLGTFVPGVDAYLLPVIAVIVAISLIPMVRELLRERTRRTRPPDADL